MLTVARKANFDYVLTRGFCITRARHKKLAVGVVVARRQFRLNQLNLMGF